MRCPPYQSRQRRCSEVRQVEWRWSSSSVGLGSFDVFARVGHERGYWSENRRALEPFESDTGVEIVPGTFRARG